MPYAVELSDSAADKLSSIADVDLVSCISNRLEDLAADPLKVGRRAGFPYRPAGQIFEFWCDSGERRYFVTLFFHFEPGERVVKISAVTYREVIP